MGAQDGQCAELPATLGPGQREEWVSATWMADTRTHADRAFDTLMQTYQAKYPKATACLAKNRQPLLAFYDSLQNTGFTCGPRT